MAQLFITYWRDIPAQVTAKAGRATAKRELPPRFSAAIDRAAMRTGAAGTDDYLAAWRRGSPIACADDLQQAVEAALAKIEAEYDKGRLAALVQAGGREQA